MKKREFIKSGLLASGGLGLFGATSILSTVSARANTSAGPFSVEELIAENFTVPSWTRYKRALVKGLSPAIAVNLLVPKERPFNIVATINGDPTSRIGITWYTNAGQTGQYLEYVKGDGNDGFCNTTRIEATENEVNDLVYNNSQNLEVSGKYTTTNPYNFNNPYTFVDDPNSPKVFELYEKRSYVSHKVLIEGLDADSLYTYRVGKEGHFRTGSFRTAKSNKDAFEFIYIADTQAHNEDYFDASTRTVTAAHKKTPNAAFLLCAGDHIESNKGDDVTPDHPRGINSSYYVENSEWEWEQWFERMQPTWLKLPVVPVQGNHDTARGRHNMFHHFNTDKSFNAMVNPEAKTDMDGTVYSFVRGDALFLVINFEDWEKGEPYFAALETWMEDQINLHPDVKWRIVTYHKTVFTGSKSHQDDADSKVVRNRMAKVFEHLGIDIALQGHDHIYEAIGVITTSETTYSLVSGAISQQTTVTPVAPDATGNTPDMTGKQGGTFNVKKGMLYFLNNSAGKKKYYPRNRAEMEASLEKHGITNYFDMFNKFGQTGEPTFSNIRVSTEDIKIDTYTVNAEGEATLFDSIKVVRSGEKEATGINGVNANALRISNEGNHQVRIDAPDAIIDVRMYAFTGAQVISQQSNLLNLSGIAAGVYLLNVRTTSGVYTERFIVKP
ncbi:MAG: fibronectin type III domain-containing protein [Dysgonamonadaceae bacterium]|jgi:hypothetical protein|nr:fibronectin type III domain-containing protein [Dysgonamonadaceae bacterium]